jgi:hypothetical protein
MLSAIILAGAIGLVGSVAAAVVFIYITYRKYDKYNDEVIRSFLGEYDDGNK